MSMERTVLLVAGIMGVAAVPLVGVPAQAAAPSEAPSDDRPATETPKRSGQSRLQRLTKDYDLWIDPKRKLVVVDGEVCLREGQLEMFACPQGTKEHESVVAVNCKAQYVHAALLAVGARPGQPVRFQPEYQPATGTEIDIYVLWKDKDGTKHTERAQQWVKYLKTGKAMPFPWVFAGSGFWTDPDTGERYYQADGGDFICVSNFPTAMLDLPVHSSQANEELLFTAFTEHIPPVGTKVRLVLIPKLDKKAKPTKQQPPGTSARE